MKYFNTDHEIYITWSIFKGASAVRERFAGSRLSVFLLSIDDSICLESSWDVLGDLHITVPGNLGEGVYGIQAIWIKNECHLPDQFRNNRNILRSSVDNIFMLDNSREITPEDYNIRLQSTVHTFGYDGLSAYELAVLHRKTTLSESEWVSMREDMQTGMICSLRRVASGFYHAVYDSLDYAYAQEYFEGRSPAPAIGGCSVIAAGGMIGRNYDWKRNDEAIFEIHTAAAQGRYATYGIAGSVAALTVRAVEARKENEKAYRVLPFYMQDGMNDQGLFAAILVVPATGSHTTVPLVEKRDRVCSTMLVRYILDNYSTVSEAVESLRDYVEIFHPTTLTEIGYEPHFFLRDADASVVLEFSGSGIVAIQSDKCTNFHLNGVTTNEDGSVWTNADVLDGHLPSSQGIEGNGSGLERWNIMNAADITDAASMRSLMNSILYSRTYTETENVWYSEYTGSGITVDTPSDDTALIARIEEYRQKYLDPEDPDIWITKQSCVYMPGQNLCRVTVREDDVEFIIDEDIIPYTKREVNALITSGGTNDYDQLINKPKIDDVELTKDSTAEELGLVKNEQLSAYRTAEAQDIIDNGKQEKLIAGQNITIASDGRTISATGGGGSSVSVIEDAVLEGENTEDLTRVPSAFSASRLKRQFDIDSIPAFDSTKTDYKRGNICIYNGKAYRFYIDKDIAGWSYSYVHLLNIEALSNPLEILTSEIDTICNFE